MPMADVAVAQDSTGEVEGDAVLSSDVAAALGKKPQSLSPARDSLLKKGLVYSGERGRIAFTVPHFGRYLRERG
jgi:Mn-dependent DtxR family transcriptional regulator